MDITDVLSQLHDENPEIEQILKSYRETERIYQGAMRAMGRISTSMSESGNSAEVTISVSPSQSLSTDKWST